MTRFYCDEAGRVIERATGRELGRVEQAGQDHDALYWPLDARGIEVRAATLIKALAVLAIVRAARPGLRVSLIDIAGNGV